MGTRRVGRDRLWGSDRDRLGAYGREYLLEAHCSSPQCRHSRGLHIPLLVRVFGEDATLGQMRSRLRCHKCGTRGARLEVRFVGKYGDGR